MTQRFLVWVSDVHDVANHTEPTALVMMNLVHWKAVDFEMLARPIQMGMEKGSVNKSRRHPGPR